MFSVIITTHNSARHIKKTLDNILHASENIQKEIILVDDGSTDNTRNIIKEFNNIKVIYQDNKGVSTARNKALSFVSDKSKLITFIDDSDKVSSNFFENHLLFFEQNTDINITFSPIINVQNKNLKRNSLNYCFDTDKNIVNIFEDYKYIRFHIGGVVFRSNILKTIQNPFDQNIHFWEDAKMINSLIVKYKEYGLVKDVHYFYNLDDENSLSKASWSKSERYSYHIKNNYLYMIDLSLYYYGVVIDYIQYLILVHYSQFLLSHNLENINITNIKDPNFIHTSKIVFKYIDKNIIYNSNLDKRYRLFLYNLKGISTYRYLKDIKIWIHNFDILKKEIIFSFSDEANYIKKNSRVYIKRKYGNHKINLCKKRKKDILHYLSPDFSMNIFSVKLTFLELFKNNIFIIEDTENNLSVEILSESVFLRLIRKMIKLCKRG